MYGNTLLRLAIRRNIVTFPSQIPVFMKQPAGSTQQRVVQLYFLRGWSVRSICDRYQLAKKIVQNLLSDWRIRAISAGLIQEITSEDLDRLVAEWQSAGKEGPFSDLDARHNLTPPGPPAGASLPVPAGKLMMALEEDCLDFGVDLSPEQLQKIERIVFSAGDPRGHNAAARPRHHFPGIDAFNFPGMDSPQDGAHGRC
jgi:hypothetical protein